MHQGCFISRKTECAKSVIALRVHQTNCALKSFSEHYKVSGPVRNWSISHSEEYESCTFEVYTCMGLVSVVKEWVVGVACLQGLYNQGKSERKRAFSLRLEKIRKTCNDLKKIDIFILYSINFVFSVHIQSLSS